MSEVKEFYDNYEADLWKAKEVPEQREIDFRGYWAVINPTTGKCWAAFLDEKIAQDWVDKHFEPDTFQIRQITEKIPFSEVK